MSCRLYSSPWGILAWVSWQPWCPKSCIATKTDSASVHSAIVHTGHCTRRRLCLGLAGHRGLQTCGIFRQTNMSASSQPCGPQGGYNCMILYFWAQQIHVSDYVNILPISNSLLHQENLVLGMWGSWRKARHLHLGTARSCLRLVKLPPNCLIFLLILLAGRKFEVSSSEFRASSSGSGFWRRITGSNSDKERKPAQCSHCNAGLISAKQLCRLCSFPPRPNDWFCAACYLNQQTREWCSAYIHLRSCLNLSISHPIQHEAWHIMSQRPGCTDHSVPKLPLRISKKLKEKEF